MSPTVALGKDTAFSTLKKLGFWQRLLHSRPDLLQVRTATDIREAKETGRLGILLAFQEADAIENDVDLIDAYKALGVGMIQLTYNEKKRDGCEVEKDEGLGCVDSRDSLLGANRIQNCFWGGRLGREGSFGFERRGVGADGAADHRPA